MVSFVLFTLSMELTNSRNVEEAAARRSHEKIDTNASLHHLLGNFNEARMLRLEKLLLSMLVMRLMSIRSCLQLLRVPPPPN
jgi:hypothetical protein